MNKRNGVWKNLGSLSGLTLVICLLTAFFAGQHQWFQWIDGQLFRVASKLVPLPEKRNDVVAIRLAENKSAQKLTRLQRQQQLAAFIKKAAAQKPAALVLIMDQLPQQMLMIDELKEINKQLLTVTKKLTGKNNKKTRKEIQKINKEIRNLTADNDLVNVILKHNVLLAVPTNLSNKSRFTPGLKILAEWPDDARPVNSYLTSIPGLLAPAVNILKIDNPEESSIVVLPVYSSQINTASWPLIWKHGENFYPDLATILYARLEGSDTYVWVEGQGLDFSSQQIKTDLAGRVVPLYSRTSGLSHELKVFEMNNVPKADVAAFNKKVVLIGREVSKSLTDVAYTVNSMRERVVFYTPTWSLFVEKLLLIAVFIYLIVIVLRLRKSAEIILGFFTLFVLVTFQFGMLLIKGIWVPVGATISLLVIGHFIIYLQKSANLKIAGFQQQVHKAMWSLAKSQFEQGDFSHVFESLKRCFPSNEVIEKLYKTGLEFERQRQYEKALDTFKYINENKKGFKDVEKRMLTLMNVNGEQPTIVSPFSGEKTLVMTDSDIQKPVIGRYELIRELGRGEMGIVYLGKDPKINREVAVKTLNFLQFEKKELKVIKERFYREAETAGKLAHPNIVTIFDVGDERDLAFIAMDYVPGQDMSAFVKEDELLPVKTVFECVIKVADALGYAHKQGVVHRDIKPGNIIYDQETRLIKVTDFGIARIMDTASTRTGTILGSPAYMSPEQLAGHKVAGTADLFSLGVTLFQLLTGEYPFKADNIASLAYKITNEKHQAIRELRPDVPKSLTRFINKVLQKDPDKRFATGHELKQALEKVLDDF